jgi:hypothetical protein
MEIPAPHRHSRTAPGMLERLLSAAVVAVFLAAIDLSVTSVLPTPWWAYHHRSPGWVGLCIAVIAASVALTVIRSWKVAMGSAILSGGVLGNLLAAHWNNGYVPNPLLLGDRSGVAFNLADVFTLLGIVILTAALMDVAIKNADRLPASSPADRWLRRRLRR